MFLTRRRSESFQFLLDKLNNRLTSWKSHCLSWAGRSTLINSTLANIPSYAMSLLKLPRKITDKIDGIIRKFWRGKPQNALHFLAPRSWETFCKPKPVGGLGFQRVEDLNKALLSPTAWSLTSKPSNLADFAF